MHDRLIAKREAEERKTLAASWSDTATEKPMFGKVIGFRKGTIVKDGEIRPLDLKVGEKISFGKSSGTEVKMHGEELIVMREEDVTAVVESLAGTSIINTREQRMANAFCRTKSMRLE